MANTTRLDPTRTTLLRRKFIGEMNRRFRRLRQSIWGFIVDDDVFGLEELPEKKELRKAGLKVLAERRAFQFMTNPKKMAAFNRWLQQRIDEGILTVETVTANPWTSKYVYSAYRQGALRAFIDGNRMALTETIPFFEASREQFLRMAFGQPEVISKLELLGTRAFEQLKGITATMSQQISRHLADGLAHGWAPIKMARAMNRDIDKLTRTRARMIARTEIINAHAEGQLDSFELLGVEKVGIMAEIATAGDALVCEECGALEGHEFSIDEARGIIPYHPNCRCAWIPSEPRRKQK